MRAQQPAVGRRSSRRGPRILHARYMSSSKGQDVGADGVKERTREETRGARSREAESASGAERRRSAFRGCGSEVMREAMRDPGPDDVRQRFGDVVDVSIRSDTGRRAE